MKISLFKLFLKKCLSKVDTNFWLPLQLQTIRNRKKIFLNVKEISYEQKSKVSRAGFPELLTKPSFLLQCGKNTWRVKHKKGDSGNFLKT